ncbi:MULTISPECIES: GNAT family N-acetyltransferase [Amycolatopsis]|uniref:GNAT family N-acetyltransferase n=1 Tax=Amycolatopsis TaxID=1813 RepID=UPI003660232C
MRIRPADVTDAVAVFTLLGQSAGGQPRRTAFDHNYEQLIAAMTYDDTDFLVADRDGEVVGYVLAARVLSLHAGGPVSHLLELVVAQAHRGQGIGGMLVDAVVRRARRAGAVEVHVIARHIPGYFERLGFAETATCLTLPLS